MDRCPECGRADLSVVGDDDVVRRLRGQGIIEFDEAADEIVALRRVLLWMCDINKSLRHHPDVVSVLGR